jgi:hypothetical protein
MRFSVRALLVDGELGGARPGMSRAEVLATLGEPDDWGGHDRRDRALVWRYGNFEAHFDGKREQARLTRLFNDDVDGLDAGAERTLDAWILDGALGYDVIVRRLRDEGVVVNVLRDTLDRPLLCVEKGGELLFENGRLIAIATR